MRKESARGRSHRRDRGAASSRLNRAHAEHPAPIVADRSSAGGIALPQTAPRRRRPLDALALSVLNTYGRSVWHARHRQRRTPARGWRRSPVANGVAAARYMRGRCPAANGHAPRKTGQAHMTEKGAGAGLRPVHYALLSRVGWSASRTTGPMLRLSVEEATAVPEVPLRPVAQACTRPVLLHAPRAWDGVAPARLSRRQAVPAPSPDARYWTVAAVTSAQNAISSGLSTSVVSCAVWMGRRG